MTAPVLDQPEEQQHTAGWPVPEDEAARLAALRGYGVLDQPRQADLDAAARLAAYVCGTPTAVINLIDAERQWQAAAHGTEPGEVGRADSMCSRTILQTDVLHTSDASRDERFATNPFVVGPLAQIRMYAAAPLVTREGHAIGTVCAYDEQAGELTQDQLGRLLDVADQVMALFEMRRMAAALARLASRDALTGLANRRSLEQAIASAIARAERGLGTPSVVVVDLAGFKGVNDSYGHAAGDAVLRSVASRLVSTARAVDTVGRVGGDEFVVLLEHTGGQGAAAALGRLRRCLEDRFDGDAGDGGPGAVGAALGMATYRPGDSVASLLSRADAEMYAEKARRGGRARWGCPSPG
jgi:diguanylate cyclase (GGDEF)-like protein